ncbi:hypothetical protein F5Y11DRAFT_314205 [Daldinia sp. FL1419]|nr:hypothetical protein F5Y11DRAFT_314205 [Daldinia sp. FL1419]
MYAPVCLLLVGCVRACVREKDPHSSLHPIVVTASVLGDRIGWDGMDEGIERRYHTSQTYMSTYVLVGRSLHTKRRAALRCVASFRIVTCSYQIIHLPFLTSHSNRIYKSNKKSSFC